MSSRSRRSAQRLGGAVAEGLVAAADGIVVHGQRVQIELGEGLAEIPGPHPGHAEAGHGLHFVKAQFQHFVEGDRIDVGVVRAGAVPGHEQRDALMQVMNHRRMPVEEHPCHGLRGFERQLVRVAVAVHEGVFRPVGRRTAGQRGRIRLALEIAVEPLHHLVAAVGIEHRIDRAPPCSRVSDGSSAARKPPTDRPVPASIRWSRSRRSACRH